MKYSDNEFLRLCTESLRTDRTYKYKELCLMLGEDTKKSNAKKSQTKRWKRFFDWENPTTHTYRITEVYDEPREIEDGRRNNGGARENSGAKPKVQEEFDYLLNAFLHREFNRNFYNGQVEWCQSHFFNGEISRYFGMYTDSFYDARMDFAKMLTDSKSDDSRIATKTMEFNDAWSDINKKIAEKRKSWIYNKIDKIDGIILQNGVIAYTDKRNGEFEYKDEYLDKWEKHMREYLREKKIRTIADVAERGLWEDMIAFISESFDGYESVERTKKITFDVNLLKDYEWGEHEEYRKRFNEKLVAELLRYFSKRTSDNGFKMYRYVIEKYVCL